MRSTEAAVLLIAMGLAAHPAWGQPASPYAGSDACGTCHEDIAGAFAKSPHHLLDTDKKRGSAGRWFLLHLLGKPSWFSEWRYYGYGEAFYIYERIRTHMLTTGLRLTR